MIVKLLLRYGDDAVVDKVLFPVLLVSLLVLRFVDCRKDDSSLALQLSFGRMVTHKV
jgi:hypothetical protein